MDKATAPVDTTDTEALLGRAARDVNQDYELDFLADNPLIGKYLVEKVLGVGGQAVCLLAHDEDLQRSVVIKLYRKGLSPSCHESVIREGRAMAKIDNRAIAKCHAVDMHDGRPFLVLEYIEGMPLVQWIERRIVNSRDALKIVRKISEGLAEVHNAGLLHLDIKPGNIVIGKDERVVLIDFGLSQDALADPEKKIVGTPAFLAPERITGLPVDRRADIFGVGTVLYFLLTGNAPFDGGSKAEVLLRVTHDSVDYDALDVLGVEKSTINICRKCLVKDPRYRIPNAETLIQEIDQAQKNTKRFAKGLGIGWAALLAGVAIGLVGLFLFNGSTRPAAQLDKPTLSRPSIQQLAEPSDQQQSEIVDSSITDLGRRVSFGGGNLKSDIAFSWHLDENFGGRTCLSSHDTIDDGPIILSLGRKYRITCHSQTGCFFKMFSYETASDDPAFVRVVSIGKVKYDPSVEHGTQCNFTFRASSLTASSQNELIWIVATTHDFDGKQKAQELTDWLMDSAQAKDVAAFSSGLQRGITEDNEDQVLISEAQIEYRVVKDKMRQ